MKINPTRYKTLIESHIAILRQRLNSCWRCQLDERISNKKNRDTYAKERCHMISEIDIIEELVGLLDDFQPTNVPKSSHRCDSKYAVDDHADDVLLMPRNPQSRQNVERSFGEKYDEYKTRII